MNLVMIDEKYELIDNITIEVLASLPLSRVTESQKVIVPVTYKKGSVVHASTYSLPNGEFVCSYYNVTEGLRHVAIIRDVNVPFGEEQHKVKKLKV